MWLFSDHVLRHHRTVLSEPHLRAGPFTSDSEIGAQSAVLPLGSSGHTYPCFRNFAEERYDAPSSLHSVPSQAQAVESSLANVCWLMKRGWRINGVNMGQKTCDARVIVLDFWIGKVSETTLPDQLRARKSPQNFILKERSLWAPLLLILFLPQMQWLLSKEPSSTHCRPLLPEEVYSPQGAVSPSTPPFRRMLLTFTNLSEELVRSWSVSMDLAFLFSSSSISVISNWEQSEHNILQYHTHLSGILMVTFACFQTLALVFQNARYSWVYNIFIVYISNVSTISCFVLLNKNAFFSLLLVLTLLSYQCFLSAPYSSCRRNTESHHTIKQKKN